MAPYIDQNARDQLDVGSHRPETLGELNYKITKLCLAWAAEFPSESYGTYAAIIGVLETAKLELYRRAVAPYEDQKIAENGDVYNV